MITPPFLRRGSKIRIVSPAGQTDEKYILPAVEWLRKEGFSVEIGKYVFARHFRFAGTDKQRFEDLQEALDDPETAVVLCARGGYGTVRIIRDLDFTNFLQTPKWVAGFSDITILHACLNNLGVASVHGAMPRYLLEENGKPSENLSSLLRLLSGDAVQYSFTASGVNRPGAATGELVGGNLSILCSLMGTRFELKTDGKILFIEDIDEYLYHADRMMMQLKLSGKLENLKGLIVGDFTGMKDNESPFGKTIHEIIRDAVEDYDYPVAFGFPAGHDKKNLALAFGTEWQLNVSENISALTQLGTTN